MTTTSVDDATLTSIVAFIDALGGATCNDIAFAKHMDYADAQKAVDQLVAEGSLTVHDRPGGPPRRYPRSDRIYRRATWAPGD